MYIAGACGPLQALEDLDVTRRVCPALTPAPSQRPAPLAHAAAAHVPPRRGRALADLRIGGGQNTWPALTTCARTRARTRWSSSDRGIVQQQDRRAATASATGTALASRKASAITRCWPREPKLGGRAHRARSRGRRGAGPPASSPARLLADSVLESAAESVHRRVVAKRAPVREPHLAAARSSGYSRSSSFVNAPTAGRRRPSSSPPTRTSCSFHGSTASQLRQVEPPLKEMMPPTQDLPGKRRHAVRWAGRASREAVDEVTPRLGRHENRHVRPAEGMTRAHGQHSPVTARSRPRAAGSRAATLSRPPRRHSFARHHHGWVRSQRGSSAALARERNADQQDGEPSRRLVSPGHWAVGY